MVTEVWQGAQLQQVDTSSARKAYLVRIVSFDYRQFSLHPQGKGQPRVTLSLIKPHPEVPHLVSYPCRLSRLNQAQPAESGMA